MTRRAKRDYEAKEVRHKEMIDDKSWRYWFREFMGCSPSGYEEIRKLLGQRYIESMYHVKLYAQYAGKTRDAALREKLWLVAAEEARHAEWLGDQLTLFRVKLPPIPEIRECNNRQDLLSDLHDKEHCSRETIAALQTVRDELPQLAEKLERIYEDGKRHQAELREMLLHDASETGFSSRKTSAGH